MQTGETVAPARQNNDRYAVIAPGGRKAVDEWGNRFTGPSSHTVTRQPGFGQVVKSYKWAPAPESLPDVPHGLEYLAPLGNIEIHQTMEWDEIMSGFESENRYRVINDQKDQIYFALEKSTGKERMAGGGYRALRLHVVDSCKKEIIRMSKEYVCCASCRTFDDDIDRNGDLLKIECPPGHVIGYVKQASNGCCIPAHYTVCDSSNTPFLFIDSPRCTCDCPCNDVIFKILDVDDGNEVGFIKKKGSVMDTYGDADIFHGCFPKDLDVIKKAVLLGGMFLVDYLHFETSGHHHHN